MTEFQDTEDTESGSPEESAVIADMRKREKALQKENKKLSEQIAEVEVAAQTRRSEAVQELMNTLGLPGLAEDVSGWIEGDATREKVVEALQARSIPLPEGQDEQPEPEEDQKPSASSVGQQVADAAAGKDGRSLEERINATENQAELDALMEEAGLTHSHY